MGQAPSRGTVLVLQAGNRSGPWACRSLARSGFAVVGAHEPGRVAGRSRYCKAPLRIPSATESPDLFLEAVERTCRERAVDAVLPTDDEAVTQLLATRLPRPAGAAFVGPTADQYRSVCDKTNLHETARRVALDAPLATYVKDGRHGAWPPLPSIVKPRLTQTQVEGALVRRKAVIVSTPAEREAAVAEVCSITGGAVVEERVFGTPWRIHFVTDGEQLAAVPVITVRTHPPGAGMSSVQTVPAFSPPDLVEASKRLIAFLGYRGHGSFQFIERDGRFYVHDVNLRLPSSVALSIRAGLDMPRLSVEVALGSSPDLGTLSVRAGVRYVWLYGELQTLLRRVRSHEPIPQIWEVAADILLAAALPRRVLDELVLSDPLPTVALVARALRRRRCPEAAPGPPLRKNPA